MLLLWSALASAARLAVIVHNPVVIWVDGKIVESPETGITLVVDNLAAGRHLVEARTALGKPLAATSVVLNRDGLAQLEYADKLFQDAATPSYGTSVASDGVSITVVTGAPGGMGTVVIPAQPAYPTTPPTPTAPPVPAAPVRTAPVEVQFLSTDGEWANVYVDGEKVLEFRNNNKGTVTLTPGLHTVEIRDFMENQTWAKGQVKVGAVAPLKIGFSKQGTVEVYNDPGAWR